MALLGDIQDKNKKCSSEGSKTGRLGCQIEFGTPKHLIALKKGTTIPSNVDFSLTYLNTLTKEGKAIPLTEGSSFEDLSAEDAITTNSSGVDRLNLKGLPKYKVMFEEGHEFYKELSKMTSFKAWDFIVGDENGNWKMAVNSNGDFKGFKGGQVIAEMTKTKAEGGDNESKSIIVQFLDRQEWDTDYSIFAATELGFQPDEVQGINPVNLTFLSEPADGDTTIIIKPVLSADNNTFVSGTENNSYIFTINGAVASITGLTEVSETSVSLTVPSLSEDDEITLTLKDSANSYGSIVGDVIYGSSALTAVVASL